MKTQVRDDAIAKNQYTVRLMRLALLSQAVVILILSGLVVYAFLAKETLYIPTNGSGSYKVSQLTVSPSYLQGVASDVMQSRLTWNQDTIVTQYMRLLRMVSPKTQSVIRQQLNEEITAVKKRDMQSVFYQTGQPLVDVKHQIAEVHGSLQRIDKGIPLPPKKVSYQIQFNYSLGHLSVESISEVKKKT